MVVIVLRLVIVEEYQVRLNKTPSPSTKWYQDLQRATEQKRYQIYIFRTEPIAINTVSWGWEGGGKLGNQVDKITSLSRK